MMTVEHLADRLDDGFRLLTGGSRTALPRQQTLRATIDWSYDLLSEEERLTLHRLAVFAGGWTLEAAEAVCAGDGIVAADVLDLLGRLVDKSLVQMQERGEGARYRLLETVRQYAGERLQDSGEAQAVHQRHTGYYLALAEQAEPALHQQADLGWLARLEAEHDNLRAALAWCMDHDPQTGLRLAGSLLRFWYLRASFSEGSRWLARVLDAADARAPERTVWRLKAVLAAGMMARPRHDMPTALARLEEALALSRELGDSYRLA
jgi:non-specific serine/threonine protein kinase